MRSVHPLRGFKMQFRRPMGLSKLGPKDRKERAYPDLQTMPLYRSFFEAQAKQLVGDFELDDVSVDSLLFLIEDLEREKIPYLLWNPRVQRNLLILMDEKGDSVAQKRFFAWLKQQKPGITIVDFNGADRHLLHCDHFRDESHLADYCYAELASRLTERFR